MRVKPKSKSGLDYEDEKKAKIAKRTAKCKIKYVGVQSWKATHLQTLDIRVEQ